MVAYQTNYGTDKGRALPGMVANSELSNRVSRTVENSEGIPFGHPAFRGSDDRGVNIDDSGTFLGVAILNQAVPPAATGAEPDMYPQYFEGAFLTEGIIWGTVGIAVSAGDTVYWDPAASKYTNVDGAGANTAIPDAVFDSSAAADGDLAKIAIKLR